jgi:DNA-binding PadR family transcriptional regulator
MSPRAPTVEGFRRRLVGLYALTQMEREGPVHGYWLSERIAERTDGAWRPGPGAVYPSLQRLQEGGLVRSATRGRRREYAITAKGRALLASIRQRRGGERPDLSALWAEVMGVQDVNELLLLRLRRSLAGLEAHLSQHGTVAPSDRELRREAARLLASAAKRIANEPSPRARRPARG